MTALTVVTLNVHNSNTTNAVQSDILGMIVGGADIIAVQEFGPRHFPALETLPAGWTGYVPPLTPGEPGGRAALPILWNSDVLLYNAHAGWDLISPPTLVEPGAGGRETTEKTVTWVNLVDRDTQQPLTVLNVHALPTVEVAGRPIDANPLRLAHYQQTMDVITRQVQRRHANNRIVFLCGDLNVHYPADAKIRDPRFPYATFERIGLASSYRTLGHDHLKYGTAGTRLIDYVAASVKPALTPIAHEVVEGYASDHRPLFVTYRVAAPTKTNVPVRHR